MKKVNPENILFVCTHNSARSQMAEAILRAKNGNRYQVYSAGTEPTNINRYVQKILTEIDIDISNLESKHVNQFLDTDFDLVVTVCDSAKEECPFIPGAKNSDHKNFPDPSQFIGTEEEILNSVRKVRDEMIEWITQKFNPNTGNLI